MKKSLLTIFVIAICVFLSECKKDPKPDVFRVTEVDVDASYRTAEINGSYTFSVIPDDMKIIYGEKDDLTDAFSSKVNVGENDFHVRVSDLKTETKYYYCFECYSSHSSTRSEVHSFMTLKAERPIVETTAVEDITLNFASCGGNVVSDCGAYVTERGVCWSTSQNPTINDNKTSDGAGMGTYNSNITGLNKNTTYYVRAYATNSVGTAYGDEKSFTTADEVLVPVVKTISVDDITQTEAECKAEVVTDGGASVTERGVCWSTSPNPTINDNITTDGSGTGTFTSNLINLTANTTYYVRAYATNSAGAGYGDVISFTTLKDIVKPTVKTNEVSSVVQDAAICGGEVVDDGGATVTARGVCWSTSPNPTTNGNHTDDGTGEGDFTSAITGLTAGTTYYVRAYATNEKGTSYGEEKSFMTSIYMDLPILTTKEIDDITETSATSGGEVVSDGGAPVIERGVCWSTSQNPTIDDNKTTDGNGTGTFTSNLTNLTAGTTYYVRAYATNVMGTAYGEQRSFATTSEEVLLPTVITEEVTDITTDSATSGGNVTDDGGTTVTARGICWSMTQNPTLDDNDGFTSDGTGTGTFVSLMECLESNTTYYVRAYATNSEGTGYGDEKSFTTEQGQLPSGTINGHDYIDLGLPSGLLWATCNIGASFPREYGNYYAWGETTTKTEYTMDNSLTYGEDVGNNISGNVQYDAATANWGDGWRMPTEEEMEELIDECDWELIEICEQKVFKVTGPSDNYILLPLAGQAQYYEGEHDPLPEEGGRYWSASGIGTTDAMDLAIDANSSYQRTGLYYRYGGRSVRPVSGGNQTEPEATLPTITTSEVSNITETSAECGGNVTSDGGATVTARGVCWSTSHNPTINDNKTTDGNGTGSFTSNLSNLAPQTTYYVRAYATNEKGTNYGEEKSFTTEENGIIIVNEVSFKMIFVEGGTFYMGATSEQGSDASTSELPVHEVTLSDYYISETEVTQELWTAVLGNNPSHYSGEQKPVETVSWHDCQDFITALNELTGLNFSLPTEAEWEYAARGGKMSQGYKYSGSNTLDDVAWYTENSGSKSHDVKTKSPNELGIYDMSGNIDEWCQDWYGNYSSDPQINPTGPLSGTACVLRGGSWLDRPSECRIPHRTGENPANKNSARGFRIAISTHSGEEPEPTPPTVTTSAVSNITYSSASSGGNVTSDGGATVTARGICWSTSHNPTINDNKTTDGNGTGNFTSNLINLTANTTYYVRAYATNEKGTAYGNEKSFTTLESEEEETSGFINGYGYIDLGLPSGLLWATHNVGATTPEEYGDYYAWGETKTKESYDSFNSITYGVDIDDFSGNARYDVARKKWGFTWRLPTNEEIQELIDNCTWTWTTQNGVNGCAVISNSNGKSIFMPSAGHRRDVSLYNSGEQGYYMSSAQDYNNSTEYTRVVYFDSEDAYRLGIARCNGYTVRPVSDVPTEEPIETVPTIITNNVTYIKSTSAICGGDVFSDGGATITEYGVCWSTSQNPTIGDNHTVDGSGVNYYSSTLSSLSPNTTYYVRAYASNENGISYGDEKCFTTKLNDDPLTGEINGHEYVDLGLPSGLKWATCNVGANSPEGYGDYYAWGEITTKEVYTEETCSTFGVELGNISGNAQYDVARNKWGSTWRMPTLDEQKELFLYCDWIWTTQNGVKGCKITSKTNGNYIFLPAAGYRSESSVYHVGARGEYYSTTPYYSYYCPNEFVHELQFYESMYNSDVMWGGREDGKTVRPVSE